MATPAPANMSTASSVTVTDDDAASTTSNATVDIRSNVKKRSASQFSSGSSKFGRTEKKCCFHEPGSPWPRNLMLQVSRKADFANHFVTLLVGPDQAEFHWFTNVLGFHSRFFAAAMDCTWVESEKRTIEMPEDDPKVVQEFIRWVSDHRLGGCGEGSDNPSLTPPQCYDLLTALWIFGSKYGIPRLQNVVVNEIFVLFIETSAFPNIDVIDKIYESTPAQSKLRNLLVDMMLLSGDSFESLIRDHAALGETFHPAFITDLFLRNLDDHKKKETEDDREEEEGLKENKDPEKKKDLREEITDPKDWAHVSRCKYHVSEVRNQWKDQKVLRPDTL